MSTTRTQAEPGALTATPLHSQDIRAWPGATEFQPMAGQGPGRLARTCMTAGAFFVGYQALRPGGVNVTLSDIAFFLAFAACLSRGQIETRPFGAMTPLWILSLALMLTGLMIGTLANGDMTRWTVISLQYLFGYLFLPLMLIKLPKEFAQRLVCTFILGILVMETVGIGATLTMTHEQAAEMFAPEFISGSGRMSSFASEPNWNGELIAFTGPLALYALSERLIPLWAFIITIAVLLWGLLLSASFTGFAAFSIGMSITLLFVGFRALASVLLVVGVAAAVFVASGAPLPAIFQKRVGNALVEGSLEEAGTFKGRVELLEQAWDTAEDTLVVGLGVEGFRKTNEVQQPVHNLFMLMLVDGGVLAFLGFSSVVALMFAMPLRRIRSAGVGAGAALAVATVFLIYTQSMPHMFSRLNIVPVVFALMLVYVRDDSSAQRG